MRVIILAAGQSQRFKEAGWETPKPFLKITWRGTRDTMLNHVLNTLPLDKAFRQVSVATVPGWNGKTKTHRPVDLIEMDPTKGPAQTALNMIKIFCKGPDSALILDADVLNSTNDLHHLASVSSCAVLVSKSDNPAHSYVDHLGRFQHIKEKEKISEYAVRGAYFIPSTFMMEFTTKLTAIVAEKDEPFLSHVFDILECEKYAYPTTYAPVDWGSPLDVKLSGAHIF